MWKDQRVYFYLFSDKLESARCVRVRTATYRKLAKSGISQFVYKTSTIKSLKAYIIKGVTDGDNSSRKFTSPPLSGAKIKLLASLKKIRQKRTCCQFEVLLTIIRKAVL